MGANIFKDIFAGIRDIIGGRSAAYEQELLNARRAQAIGANAIESGGSMLVE